MPLTPSSWRRKLCARLCHRQARGHRERGRDADRRPVRVRRCARRGARRLEWLRGEAVDKVVLGLAGTGIAVTAGLYATGGLAAPARAGLSVVKAARRGGYIGAAAAAAAQGGNARGAHAFRPRPRAGAVEAGMRGALDGLKLADNPKDVAKLARLADAKGTKTRAIVKLLGRGAIVLTGARSISRSWVFWAMLNLLACCALKRAVERMTLRHRERRR